MGNVLDFPLSIKPQTLQASRKTLVAQPPAAKTDPKDIPVVRINDICLAVAYYAGIGRLDTADAILQYVNVHKLYNNYLHVTKEIENLVGAIDAGMVVMGTFPSNIQK
jgi:hypothetical protein